MNVPYTKSYGHRVKLASCRKATRGAPVGIPYLSDLMGLIRWAYLPTSAGTLQGCFMEGKPSPPKTPIQGQTFPMEQS